MKILLIGVILLALTSCGTSSTENTDQQRALIEYEHCLRVEEANRLMLFEQLSGQAGKLPDEVFGTFSPDQNGKIAAVEAAIKNCRNYRP